MAGNKAFREREKVSRFRGAIAKAENNSNCKEIYFKSENIRLRLFKIHEPSNRCINAIVTTDTTFIRKTEVKVIVGDLERVRGKTDLTNVFRQERKV